MHFISIKYLPLHKRNFNCGAVRDYFIRKLINSSINGPFEPNLQKV